MILCRERERETVCVCVFFFFFFWILFCRSAAIGIERYHREKKDTLLLIPKLPFHLFLVLNDNVQHPLLVSQYNKLILQFIATGFLLFSCRCVYIIYSDTQFIQKDTQIHNSYRRIGKEGFLHGLWRFTEGSR